MNTSQDKVSPNNLLTREGVKEYLTATQGSPAAIIQNRHHSLQHSVDFLRIAKEFYEGKIQLPFDYEVFSKVMANAFKAAEERALEEIQKLDSAAKQTDKKKQEIYNANHDAITTDKLIEKTDSAFRKKRAKARANIRDALGKPMGLSPKGRHPMLDAHEIVAMIETLRGTGPAAYLNKEGELVTYPDGRDGMEPDEAKHEVARLKRVDFQTIVNCCKYYPLKTDEELKDKEENNIAQQNLNMDALESLIGITDE